MAKEKIKKSVEEEEEKKPEEVKPKKAKTYGDPIVELH